MPTQSILDINGVSKSFERPPDCPPYVEVAKTYGTGSNGVALRDRALPVSAGVDPAIVTEPDHSAWLTAGSGHSTLPQSPLTGESKARFIAAFNHFTYDDAIRNYDAPGQSHLHSVIGGPMHARLTWETARRRAGYAMQNSLVASTAAGGPINATAYWHPTPFNGNGDAVPTDHSIIYYSSNPATMSLASGRIPTGLRYVTGINMEDPDDVGVQDLVDSLNAQPGTSGRYSKPTSTFRGWTLYDNTDTIILTTGGQQRSPYLKAPDGSNPWGASGANAVKLVATINAPTFWDATNIWSPGGYVHLTQGLLDSVAPNLTISGQGFSGPEGYLPLPRLIITFWFYVSGLDYLNWTLSSDAHADMVAGRDLGACASFHTDWLGAWLESAFDDATGWQHHCVAVYDGGEPAACDSSQINLTQRLVGGFTGDNAPDGTRSPQVPINSNPPPVTMPAGNGVGPFTVG